MKEFLEANGAQCYHTFDHSEPSNPFLALGDERGGLFSFNPSIVVVSDVQDIRNYIFDIQPNDFTVLLNQFNRLKIMLSEQLHDLLRRKLPFHSANSAHFN